LITHYFKSKRALHSEVTEFPVDLGRVRARIATGPVGERGNRLASMLLELLHDRDRGAALTGLHGWQRPGRRIAHHGEPLSPQSSSGELAHCGRVPPSSSPYDQDGGCSTTPPCPPPPPRQEAHS
jgi:hypothetical protein